MNKKGIGVVGIIVIILLVIGIGWYFLGNKSGGANTIGGDNENIVNGDVNNLDDEFDFDEMDDILNELDGLDDELGTDEDFDFDVE